MQCVSCITARDKCIERLRGSRLRSHARVDDRGVRGGLQGRCRVDGGTPRVDHAMRGGVRRGWSENLLPDVVWTDGVLRPRKRG